MHKPFWRARPTESASCGSGWKSEGIKAVIPPKSNRKEEVEY